MSLENIIFNDTLPDKKQNNIMSKDANKNNIGLRNNLDLKIHEDDSTNIFSELNLSIDKNIQSSNNLEEKLETSKKLSNKKKDKNSSASPTIFNTYQNQKILGLEIDYINKTTKRLRGAENLTAGIDFDKFIMYGGRKRCIVNLDGSIKKFITSKDKVDNEMAMVYQPAFYYSRIPISTTKINNGIRIDKEHLYISDKQYDGFKLHPAFYDENGHEVKYILLSAFESSAYRIKTDTLELEDKQNVDLINDRLVSTINSIPISGIKQNFTIESARTMAKNNGKGWNLFNLENISINQMLMTIEYGTLNMQEAFNLGSTQVKNSSSYNNASITGSTFSLNNKTGQASSTTNKQDIVQVYAEEGQCAISYRGVENPYGNIWQYIDGLIIKNGVLTYNNETIDFKTPTSNGWVNAFGYDEKFDWLFLPIETSNKSSFIGDYMFARNDSKAYNCVVGGAAHSKNYSGLFCYGLEASEHSRNYSARVVHIPEANSIIEKNNYQLWLSSNV